MNDLKTTKWLDLKSDEYLKAKFMSAEQMLEQYILENPDYWEFENEMQEVKRLKALCKLETSHKKTA